MRWFTGYCAHIHHAQGFGEESAQARICHAEANFMALREALGCEPDESNIKATVKFRDGDLENRKTVQGLLNLACRWEMPDGFQVDQMET